MADYTTINRIRDAVLKCSSMLLDRQLINQHELQDIFAYLSSGLGDRTKYIDLPVRSIASINRAGDTWYEGDDWRRVINNRLQGEDWKSDVFDYFERDIFDKEFPAPGSRGGLSLISYEGVTVPNCGNHRTAAAYCWLISTRGEGALLRKANVRLVSLNRRRLLQCKDLFQAYGNVAIHRQHSDSPDAVIKDYYRNCSLLHLARVETSGVWKYFAIEEAGSYQLFPFQNTVLNKLLISVREAMGMNKRRFDRKQLVDHLENQYWIKIPSVFFEIIDQNDWFQKEIIS